MTGTEPKLPQGTPGPKLSPPRRVRVVAALLRRDGSGEVLVQQRGPQGARALLWEFPGGKVEPGESDVSALARECREEMDVAVEVIRQVDEVRHVYSDLEVELVLLAGRIVEGEPRALHAQQLQWVAVDRLGDLAFCEADKPFIEALQRGEY
ncbi:MAG: (deoxy)nucleoside triphosphate pyrophosphohydrolase [Deltaproteobacteria bacterium]|nr:(deoxy)nucleoside triphosphate pyrophosphohydrolase [Deltaproteobacteria bacterium]